MHVRIAALAVAAVAGRAAVDEGEGGYLGRETCERELDEPVRGVDVGETLEEMQSVL